MSTAAFLLGGWRNRIGPSLFDGLSSCFNMCYFNPDFRLLSVFITSSSTAPWLCHPHGTRDTHQASDSPQKPKEIKQEKAEGRERRAPATTTANPLHSRTVGLPSLGLRSPPIGGKGPLQSHSICFSAKMVLGFVVYWFTCFALEAGFFSGRVV